MLINHEREKLTQAVLYFARTVRLLGKVKLFKLLYFLDFEHFRDTGRSVTGLTYSAWKMGPVPVELHNELKAQGVRWDDKVEFHKKLIKNGESWMLDVRPLAAFDPSHFSRRELRILEKLATDFRDTAAEDMVEATHLENSPWHKVWDQEGRHQAEIPYAYALRAQEDGEMRAVVEERSQMRDALFR